MSTQTEYIGLHQWESTDPFLREDFNEDNRKIDQKVKAAQERIEQTAGGLENMSYNIYNLLLRDYYEGKYTGFKRGLMFDGFLDESRISSWEGSAYRDTEAHTISIDTVGQADVARPATSTKLKSASTKRYITQDWIAQGNGTITAVSVYGNCPSYGVSQKVSFSIWQGDEKLADAENEILFVRDSPAWYEFSVTCPIRKDEVYQFRLYNTGSGGSVGDIFCYRMEGEEFEPPLALGIVVTGGGSTTGAMNSTAEQMGAWKHAVCYVRHNGQGQVGVKLGDGSGKWESAENTGSSAVETMEGEPCMESIFRLDTAQPGETAALQLTMTAQSGNAPVVYDYGVIFTE